jgi:hypothetical protein
MEYIPTLKKVPADSVPYGEQITRRGGHVWAAYSGEQLVAVGATAKEARAKYTRVRRRIGESDRPNYEMTGARRDKPHTPEPGEQLGTESNSEYIKRIRKED